jgi:hypothetical protein
MIYVITGTIVGGLISYNIGKYIFKREDKDFIIKIVENGVIIGIIIGAACEITSVIYDVHIVISPLRKIVL